MRYDGQLHVHLSTSMWYVPFGRSASASSSARHSAQPFIFFDDLRTSSWRSIFRCSSDLDMSNHRARKSFCQSFGKTARPMQRVPSTFASVNRTRGSSRLISTWTTRSSRGRLNIATAVFLVQLILPIMATASVNTSNSTCMPRPARGHIACSSCTCHTQLPRGSRLLSVAR